MPFLLAPCGLDFFDSSPRRIVNEVELPLDAARAFDLCATPEGLAAFLEDFVASDWTSPPPHGVGSTRDVKLRLLTVSERFLVWEPGKRVAFTMTSTTLPVFSRAAEDLVLTPVAADRTRLVWTIHYDVPWWARPAHPLTRAVFTRLFRRSTARMAQAAAARAGGPPG